MRARTIAQLPLEERVFLDNNVLDYLQRGAAFTAEQLDRVRNRFLDEVDRRRRLMIWSRYLYEEVAGVARKDRPLFERMVTFAWHASRGLEVRDAIARYALEFAKGRALTDAELFTPFPEWADGLRSLLSAANADAFAAHQRRVSHRWLVGERKRKKEVLEDHSDAFEASSRKVLKDGFAKHERRVAAFCLIEMRKLASGPLRGKISHDETQWPDPRTLPTMWHAESFLTEYLRRILVTGTNTDKEPDAYDLLHFREGAYSDVLVTGDRRLREIAAATSIDTTVLDFADWMHRELRRDIQSSVTSRPRRRAPSVRAGYVSIMAPPVWQRLKELGEEMRALQAAGKWNRAEFDRIVTAAEDAAHGFDEVLEAFYNHEP